MRALLFILIFALIHPASAYVVVTISDLKPIVEAVCGNRVEVVALLKPNTDPHDFSLSSRDVEVLKKAELIVLANSHLLGFEAKIKEEFDNVLDFDDYNVELEDFPGYSANPHGYWLKPKNAIAIAKRVSEELAKLHPEYADEFAANYQKFAERVEQALEEAKDIARDVRGKKFVAMVPGVCYIASSLEVSVAAVLLSEGSGFVSAKELEIIKSKLESGEYEGIIVPEFMRGAKGGEIAEQLAKDTGCRLAYVKFSAGDIDYDIVLISNAARIAYSTKPCSKSSNTIVYALSIACLVEGALLFFMRVRS